MPRSKREKVESLHLDLHNYRTIHQSDEEHAINALIGIDPDRFWALMESLLDDGYSPTENIIVLEIKDQLVVKEGNRRIASMKLILKLESSIEVPEHIQTKIDQLPARWKSENSAVPCAIYSKSESALVDRLVSRTHAKGEKAGRADWPTVARARYNRDQNNASEIGLDLLEKYLASGKNLTVQQAERWAGEYYLTVLDEALPKLAPHLNFKTAAELVSQYPGKNKKLLDRILYDIGTSQLGFKEIRGSSFFGLAYGLTPKPQETAAAKSKASTSGSSTGSSTTSSKKTQFAALASNDRALSARP